MLFSLKSMKLEARKQGKFLYYLYYQNLKSSIIPNIYVVKELFLCLVLRIPLTHPDGAAG